MSISLVTWNMQGGSFGANPSKTNILYHFFNQKYDFICLQEATEPLPAFTTSGGTPIAPYATREGVQLYIYPDSSPSLRSSPRLEESTIGKDYCCYYYRWGKNSRNSIVTYVKRELIRDDDFGIIEYSKDTEIRPMLWIQVPGKNFIIGNVHLPSGRSHFASKVFDDFKSGIESKGKPYAIVGDFNIPTKDFDKRPDKEHFHSVRVATQQSGGTLDHVYCENGNVNFSGQADLTTSDHRYLLVNLYPNSSISKRKAEGEEQVLAAKRSRL